MHKTIHLHEIFFSALTKRTRAVPGRAVLLLSVCLLSGCGTPAEQPVRNPVPVRSVQSRTELTDAAAEMLMQTEASLTAAVPPELYAAAADCIPAAETRSVLCGTMLDTLTWERRGRYLTVNAVYTEDPEAVRGKKRRLAAYASEWAKTVAEDPGSVRVLLAHELLCTGCTYSENAPDCGSAFGALIGSAARCSGFAEGFALLLEAADVPVRIVTGTAAGDPHAWNLVRLDGHWYHTDCTWDSTAADRHAYFLRDDRFMMQTHTWDRSAYPAADGGACRYETIVREMQEAVIPSSDGKTGRRVSASALH